MTEKIFKTTMHPSIYASDAHDLDLRTFVIKVYSYMTLALIVSAAVSFYSAHAFINAMYADDEVKVLGWFVMLAPLGLAFYLGLYINRLSLIGVQICYWLYAIMMGLSLSLIALTFSGESIFTAFSVTGLMFGGMSLYGYYTRRDLTGVGSFLIMSLWGLIAAILVNIFLHSSGLQFLLSLIGVVMFVGLTAYDAQKLKSIYSHLSVSRISAGKMTIIGALTLYLDFINIFLNLLTIFGRRKR